MRGTTIYKEGNIFHAQYIIHKRNTFVTCTLLNEHHQNLPSPNALIFFCVGASLKAKEKQLFSISISPTFVIIVHFIDFLFRYSTHM